MKSYGSAQVASSVVAGCTTVMTVLALGAYPRPVHAQYNTCGDIIDRVDVNAYSAEKFVFSGAVLPSYVFSYIYLPQPTPAPTGSYCYVDLEEPPLQFGQCVNGNQTMGAMTWELVEIGEWSAREYALNGIFREDGLIVDTPCPPGYCAWITYDQVEHDIVVNNGAPKETLRVLADATVEICGPPQSGPQS